MIPWLPFIWITKNINLREQDCDLRESSLIYLIRVWTPNFLCVIKNGTQLLYCCALFVWEHCSLNYYSDGLNIHFLSSLKSINIKREVIGWSILNIQLWSLFLTNYVINSCVFNSYIAYYICKQIGPMHSISCYADIR